MTSSHDHFFFSPSVQNHTTHTTYLLFKVFGFVATIRTNSLLGCSFVVTGPLIRKTSLQSKESFSKTEQREKKHKNYWQYSEESHSKFHFQLSVWTVIKIKLFINRDCFCSRRQKSPIKSLESLNRKSPWFHMTGIRSVTLHPRGFVIHSLNSHLPL